MDRFDLVKESFMKKEVPAWPLIAKPRTAWPAA